MTFAHRLYADQLLPPIRCNKSARPWEVENNDSNNKHKHQLQHCNNRLPSHVRHKICCHPRCARKQRDNHKNRRKCRNHSTKQNSQCPHLGFLNADRTLTNAHEQPQQPWQCCITSQHSKTSLSDCCVWCRHCCVHQEPDYAGSRTKKTTRYLPHAHAADH